MVKAHLRSTDHGKRAVKKEPVPSPVEENAVPSEQLGYIRVIVPLLCFVDRSDPELWILHRGVSSTRVPSDDRSVIQRIRKVHTSDISLTRSAELYTEVLFS